MRLSSGHFGGGTSSRPARAGVFPAARPSLTAPNTFGLLPDRRAPFWTFARRSGTVPWEGRQTCDGCDDRIPGTYIRRAPRRLRPCIDPPRRAPCAAADAVFADAKAFLSSSEARQMSEFRTRTGTAPAGPGVGAQAPARTSRPTQPERGCWSGRGHSGVECSEPREHESHAETASGTMQVVGLGCARRGHDGLHRLDAALNLLPERYLVEMRRRVTIATASRAPPRTPWKPPWYSTSSTWSGDAASGARRRLRRACRHLVRDPMGDDRRTVTLGSVAAVLSRRVAGALMRTANLASAVLARGLDKRRLRER